MRLELTEAQRAILQVLQQDGPMTDEQLENEYARKMNSVYRHQWPKMGPSGPRSRRNELVEMGLAHDSGLRTLNSRGISVKMWAALSPRSISAKTGAMREMMAEMEKDKEMRRQQDVDSRLFDPDE